MTGADETAEAEREALVDRALEAVGPGIDRGFGDDSIAHCLATAYADAVEVLRAAGPLDYELVDGLLFALEYHVKGYVQLIEAVVESTTQSEVVEILWADIDEALYEHEELMVSEHIGEVEGIASIDSSSFGGMTSGWIALWALRRGAEVTSYMTGDDCGGSYCMEGRWQLAEDPHLRGLRLAFAEAHGGYGPGMSIAADDIDDELREMTLTSSFRHHCWTHVIECGAVDDRVRELVAQYADAFAASTHQDDTAARLRLTTLFETAVPHGEVEARFLWDVWKARRP